MKVLLLGDIVGRPGRNFLTHHLSTFLEQFPVDFVVANGENAAGGAGITAKTATEIQKAGVQAITLGDHVWDQKILTMRSMGSTMFAGLPTCPQIILVVTV